ncbi:GAF domain-containing sensor histidine kinase [Candidatus Leptofilum sp.]|uniref:GAF domain-containing sensor histidine kinase n=1 Tax=Candidatus Leptofilum sp. TaxID=3241576 RepID=UPI003B593117
MFKNSRTIDSLLEAVCQATLQISEVGNLPETLQRIVDTGRELLAARYAVLATFNEGEISSSFVYSGIDPAQAKAIAHLPMGIGLLGDIAEKKQTFRIDDLKAHPRFSGFPAGHPEMNAFLGMPLVKGGVVYGRIYLADKLDEEPFTSTDEQVLQLFASHAAVAIQNAHLIESNRADRQQLQQKNRQLAALDKATMAISGELTLDKVLQQIVDAARELADAQYAALGVPNSHGSLDTFVDSGIDPEISAQIPHLPKGLGLLGAIIKEQKTIRIPRISDDPRSVGFPEGHPPMVPLLGVPVIAGREILGNLYLTNKIGANEFTETDQDLVELLAAHAAVAIQNARLYEQVGRLAIVEERTRIGMDLHDGIIQSIFAVGLTLESTKLSLHTNPDDADYLLTHAIEALNTTIRDIRNFILDLRPHRFQGNLEQGLGRLVREFQANTMVAVSLSAQQDHLSQVPASVARSLFLTTQEALANIARHANAEQVLIHIDMQEGNVILRVSDDGRGFDMASKNYSVGHGLSNMRARAEDMSGSFDIQSAPGKGTQLKIAFPLTDLMTD